MLVEKKPNDEKFAIASQDGGRFSETKIKENIDRNINDCRLICMETKNPHYGTGFIISRKWKNNIYKYWKISDRISVLQLKTKESRYESEHQGEAKLKIRKVSHFTSTTINRKKTKQKLTRKDENGLITIINVYALTSDIASKHPEEVDQLYHQISNIINKYKNKSLITLIAGDFNSRVGKAKEECTGIYGKGKRNDNGQLLIDFCNINKLFLANTAFNHPAKHITTWANQRQNANKDKVITIYSQIDFIIVLQKQKHILQDARSFSGTMTSSDHRLVLSKIKVKPFQVFKKTRTVKDNIKKVDITHLTNNENMRKAYQQNLETSLQSNVSENINNIRKKKKHKKNGMQQIPRNRNHGHNYDPEIEQMSKTQKELRIQISNCEDLDKMTRLKSERNNIMRRIKDKLLENKTKEIENKLSEIYQMKDTAKTFKALRMLHSKPYENPYVHDETGKHIASPQLVYETIKSHFQTQFYKPNETNLQQFIDNPKPLNQPITTEEIRKCANLLNNNRASGFDNISAELIKYAPTICHNEIADIVNDCFNKNEDIDVGKGILIPLCKPKKPKGPVKNLRPVTLLPIIRKIISNVALQRIKPKIDDYLSLSQSAFRQNRSTLYGLIAG
ncbi:uncharacterized protein LOC130623039 [Hydractinia symbiolongicarpus]|uniref:uncharacterized protein LOC130623039 n=1 Tax=Hydractinia symbiolongicarpus TaxID=13093 RepID=UPI002550F8DD|nr:uncharacterized protein LOC130623039 [Hydractinia symbiolongicarpus]